MHFTLFFQPPGNIRTKDDDDEEDEDEEEEEALDEPEAPPVVLQGQVYVNASPPLAERGAPEAPAAAAPGRPRSRSYDRHLDKSPGPPRLGSLERMLSCPVRLSEGGGALAATPTPPPPRVTSFAEIARSKRRHGGSPSLKADPFSSTEFSPDREGAAAPPVACCAQDATSETNAEGLSSVIFCLPFSLLPPIFPFPPSSFLLTFYPSLLLAFLLPAFFFLPSFMSSFPPSFPFPLFVHPHCLFSFIPFFRSSFLTFFLLSFLPTVF